MKLLQKVGHLWKEECVPSSQVWDYTAGDRKALNILKQSLAGSKIFLMDNSVHGGNNGLVVGKTDCLEDM